MLSPLSPARRRARLLAATALISLTAACGPAVADRSQAGADAAVEEARTSTTDATVPSETPAPPAAPVTTPAPVPPVEVLVPPTATPVESAASGPTVVPDAEQAAEDAPADDAVSGASTGTGAEEQVAAAGRAPQLPAAPAQPAGTAGTGGASGGSGGSFTDQARTSFTARNGQTGQYLRYAAGIDPGRAVGLVVYVDGTGEYGIDNPTSSYALGGSAGLVAVDRTRNLITLAVESPNQSCECWHTGDTTAYADFLAQLIEAQLSSYPITDVWLAGFSSGSQEITRFLVPQHPELMRLGGGWVVFGGGGPPAGNGAAVTAAAMTGVRGHWYTGTADTSVPLTASWGAQAGERWYAGRGVRVSSEYPAGVEHTLGGRLGATVARVVDGG